MLRFSRGAGICAAVVLLAGCGGAQIPVGAPGTQQATSAALPAARGSLLYVTGGCGGTCVYSYPKAKPKPALSLSGAGLCSDKHGNVFMPSADSGNAVVYEYAHGASSPKATLSVPGILAEGCSVDPTTGNLAVTYLCQNCSYGPVAIFQNAQGTPTSYEQQSVFLSYCGYDDKGNLFADGNGSGGFALLELPAGGNVLSPISVNQSISAAGQVQWDGTYVAIEDLSNPVIYQFQVSGSAATRKGTTTLTGAGVWGGQSWIQGGTVVVPFTKTGYSPDKFGFWKYPAGGTATKIVKKHLGTGTLAAATVSVRR